MFWVNLDINDGHIEYFKGWHVTKDTHSYVLNCMRYCPFCGKELKIGNKMIGNKGKTFVTFGQNHAHAIGGTTFDKDSICVIEDKSREEGRKTAVEAFDRKFCTSYFEDEWVEEKMIMYFPRGYVELP